MAKTKLPLLLNTLKYCCFYFFRLLALVTLNLSRRSRSLVRTKDFNVLYLPCKFGMNSFLGGWLVALSFFSLLLNTIPLTRCPCDLERSLINNCLVRASLPKMGLFMVWYLHNSTEWTFCCRWLKKFLSKNAFLAVIWINCICDLDLCTYAKNLFWYN